MKKLWCKLTGHNFQRVSDPVPTKFDDEFPAVVEGVYDWHYALGKCRKCGRFRMVRCQGAGLPFRTSDMKTAAEWLEILKAEYLRLAGK